MSWTGRDGSGSWWSAPPKRSTAKTRRAAARASRSGRSCCSPPPRCCRTAQRSAPSARPRASPRSTTPFVTTSWSSSARAAEDEVERLAALLANLLVLAREGQDRPEPEAVDLEHIALDARDRWQAEAEDRGHRITVDGVPGVRVLASPEDVGIILANLIDNALKYSSGAGTVTVQWGRRGERGLIAV